MVRQYILPVWVDEVLDKFPPLPPISTKMWICFYIYISILVLHVCILGWWARDNIRKTWALPWDHVDKTNLRFIDFQRKGQLGQVYWHVCVCFFITMVKIRLYISDDNNVDYNASFYELQSSFITEKQLCTISSELFCIALCMVVHILDSETLRYYLVFGSFL